MITFKFTKLGAGTLKALPMDVQKRILGKLLSMKNHPDIFSVTGELKGIDPATHKLRIGSYRLILALKQRDKSSATFHVLRAGHRKDIYKNV
jgi:mRNA-degrading endonuclease RelE of RelBE toxin-antitoxin system